MEKMENEIEDCKKQIVFLLDSKTYTIKNPLKDEISYLEKLSRKNKSLLNAKIYRSK